MPALAFVITPGRQVTHPRSASDGSLTGSSAGRQAAGDPGRNPGRQGVLPRAIRSHRRRRGIRAVIPQPADQAANRKRLGGRPPAFDRAVYKRRNTVERCIKKLKPWRGLATRYDKTATIYLAGLHLAAIFICVMRRKRPRRRDPGTELTPPETPVLGRRQLSAGIARGPGRRRGLRFPVPSPTLQRPLCQAPEHRALAWRAQCLDGESPPPAPRGPSSCCAGRTAGVNP
ncbi:transposase [Streptomyces sp. CJ_13]|nr:transposase [Streptomyces sp. CJ_13]